MKFTTLLSIAASALMASQTTAFPTVKEGVSEQCPNGYEVRPEWSQMSRKHRKQYISALQCMINKPSTVNETQVTSQYEDNWYTHQFPGHAIHFTAPFPPWHRHYVYTYHQELRACGYEGAMPFWAWDWNSDDIFKSSIFDADPEVGLGTNGTYEAHEDGSPVHAFAVTNGGLANHQIEYPFPHTFQRNLQTLPKGSEQPLDRFIKPEEVEKVLSFDKYEDFHRYMEGAPPHEAAHLIPGEEGTMGFAGMHGAVHRMVGGDMATIIEYQAPSWCPSFESDESANYGANASPNDPLFFLHHANVDRVYAMWQDRDPENRMYAYGGFTFHNYTTQEGTGVATLNDTMSFGFLTDDIQVHEAMDYRQQYCYVYADKDYREEDNLIDFFAEAFQW